MPAFSTQESILRERWFWAAALLLSYQTGLTTFYTSAFVANGGEVIDYTYFSIRAYYGITLLTLLAIGYLVKFSMLPTKKVWQYTSIASLAGILLGAFVVGENGFMNIYASWMGIPIAYSLIFEKIFKVHYSVAEKSGWILTISTFIIWLVLISNAHRINKKLLYTLTFLFFFYVLSSIAGCAAIPTQLHD